ncbi:S1 RNA-binding domain-containing protein [Patescibacteria group bacterium]|nr:S1 RNA-binding domain-containing protein [Patescibacteria group bacterium]
MAKKKAVQPETEVNSQVETTPTEEVQEPQSAPKATSTTAPKTMAELLGNPDFVIRTPKKGETVSGKITEKTRKMLMIDIGGKTEGLVVDKEFDAARDYIDQLNVGDQVEAYVLSSENERGQILLSLKKAAMDTKWDEFTKAMEDGEIVEVKGLEVNKGGLIVVIDGIRGFIPTSQFGKEYVGNLQKMKNRKLQVKVIEVDKEKNRLIFSEKHVSEAAEMAQRAQALTSVKVGETYEGVVSGVMPFGLFVTVSVPLSGEKEEVGHIEGLVHISEMSWEKVNDPHELYKVGQHIKVKVLGVEEAAGKLNLSLKQLAADPWIDIENRYPVGTTVTGTVSRIVQFGVFVKVEPGVDGLIHTSKLSPDQQFQPGDQVTVVVESVEPAQRRMSLSAVLTEVPMGYK